MSESVILCEGFYDRAFWTGWLKELGCADPGAPDAGESRRKKVLDPFGTPVDAGQFAFRAPGGRFIRIVPCHGKSQIPMAARVRLRQRTSKALDRLIINVDSDLAFGTDASTSVSDRVQQIVWECDPTATRDGRGDWLIDGGSTLVSTVEWKCDDASVVGVPSVQTLERLICSAVAAAYPQRAPAVEGWLASRPEPPLSSPKEFAWSYMAGWYSDCGCEYFCQAVWTDALIAEQLRLRLTRAGAWRIAESLIA